MAIGCLPLADGYTATIRNFDIQTQKVKFLKLTVAGVESVKVPAGTFDAYRVEVSAAEGGADKKTIWVAKDSHQVVKVKAVMSEHHGSFAGILCTGIVGGAVVPLIIGRLGDLLGLRAGMMFLYITFGCVLSVGLWARPIITNATFGSKALGSD